MSGTVSVWPNVGLTVLEEDGVTVVPSTGISIAQPIAEYYLKLLRLKQLLTYDPLGLSGDPVTVPPITRVSGALVGLANSDLTARTGASLGDLVETTGDTDPADGFGDIWRWIGSTGTVDGRRVKAGVGGNWQRAKMSARGEIDLCEVFGFRSMASIGVPDNNGKLADFWAWAATASGTAPGANRQIIGRLPVAKYAYYVSDAQSPPGTNHDYCLIEGEGIPGTDQTGTSYGSGVWTDPEAVSGTAIMAAPGKDVFRLENDGVTLGTAYHRLNLRNIALLASGAGMGINMAVPSTAGDWQAGRVQLENVLIAGAKCGWQVASYEKASHRNLRIHGCDTAIRGGVNVYAGINLQEIVGLDIGGCNVAFELIKIVDGFWIYGANIQGVGTVIKVPAGATGRGFLVSGGRCETYQNLLNIDPSIVEIGVVLRDWGLASGAGLAAPNGPVALHGSGWTFDRIDTGSIDFNGDANQDTIFRDCYPRTTNAVSVPTHNWSVYCDNVTEKQDNAVAGASFTPTWPSCYLTRELQQNLTVNLPAGGYPTGRRIRCGFYQGGAGGYTITFDAGYRGKGRYSNTGNAVGTRCWVDVEHQVDGNPYIANVTPWVLD